MEFDEALAVEDAEGLMAFWLPWKAARISLGAQEMLKDNLPLFEAEVNENALGKRKSPLGRISDSCKKS